MFVTFSYFRPSLIFVGKVGVYPSGAPSSLLLYKIRIDKAGNTKGGSISVPLTSCLTGLDKFVLQIKTKIVTCHKADSKPVKQEVNGTVILPPLVFPG